MSTPLRIGFAGAGTIAGTVAGAVKQAAGAELTAVASRRPESAEAFAETHGIAAHGTWQDLIASNAVDAIYVATPTAVREEICVAAARAGKHVLGDKPFASLESLKQITGTCKRAGVAFMDATHFSHHPRTRQLKATLAEQIGRPQAVHSSFFFPLSDRSNIRFDPRQEPTGAVGDMGWYSMRAIAEFMPENLSLRSVSGGCRRDAETGAVIRGAGVMEFENGNTSTWNFGYSAGVILMDLDILGTDGMVRLDDFVLDWAQGFGLDDPGYAVGYTRRAGLMTPSEFEYVETPSGKPQAVHMIESFAALAADPSGEAGRASIAISENTQRLLDAAWRAVSATGTRD